MTNFIETGKTALGIEFGSTRIKAVLVDEKNKVIATGAHEWENRHVGHIWTYTLEDVITGLQACYAALAADVKERYGVTLTTVGSIGISGMMHGYMAFDKAGRLLVPFRTWRCNTAAQAAEKLTEIFGYHIPARWSVAHLYQAVLDKEPHVKSIARQTTLAGFVHEKLTGKNVVGIGEASGMFPVNPTAKCYDEGLLSQFNSILKEHKLPFRMQDILPEILLAGQSAGTLTREGALLLDPTGNLKAGIPLCPPEGDAGTGMVATNAVKRRTGNVSAGTSVFAMIVLERGLKRAYPEIDLVTTPAGDLVGMVHCNNCSSDLNGWVNLFEEFSRLIGADISKSQLFELLFREAERGDKDCGGLLSYNCVSNEHITGVEHGRPLFVRKADGSFNLKNFMRSHLYAAFGALKVGCDILLKEEGCKVDCITAHGGIFKTEGVAQGILAAALNTPVTVMNTAGEGGAWGMAVLANFCRLGMGEALEDYLEKQVFEGGQGTTLTPDPADVKGFEEFAKRYAEGLPIVREAVRSLK